MAEDVDRPCIPDAVFSLFEYILMEEAIVFFPHATDM